MYDLCHTWYSESTSVDYRSRYFYHKYTFSVCSKCVARNKKNTRTYTSRKAQAQAQAHRPNLQITPFYRTYLRQMKVTAHAFSFLWLCTKYITFISCVHIG